MKTDLFQAIPSPDDQRLQRIQDNLRVAVNKLAADHDVASAPVTSYTATAQVAAGASVVAFRGGPGQTLTLPSAASQGTNTGMETLLANTSPVAVTVRPSGADTLAGGKSVSVAAGTAIVLVADGISKWLVIATGGVTDGDKGDIIVTGGGTVWTIDPSFTSALLATVAADFAAVSDVDDLERRFRLLLKDYSTTFQVPPGLEDEFPLALATD